MGQVMFLLIVLAGFTIGIIIANVISERRK